MKPIMRQLPLAIALPESASLDTFVEADNSEAVAALRHQVERRDHGPLYLHGGKESGKTHLLQAACHLAAKRDMRPVYLSLATTESLHPDVLRDLGGLELLAIDDLDQQAGVRAWEHALFNLLNTAREQATVVIVAATTTPEALGLCLPDLRSRLAAGLTYRLQKLNDQSKLRALQLRATQRGLELTEEVGLYLLSHYPRNLRTLLDLLSRLDNASLIEQRRLTIPFIRQALSQSR